MNRHVGWLSLLLACPDVLPATKSSVPEWSRATMPVHFEPNRGQFPPGVRFQGKLGALRLLLGDRNIELRAGPGGARLSFSGSSVVRLVGLADTGGHTSYLLGSDSRRHIRKIPHFGSVLAKGMYKGIDVEYHARRGELEYDFIVGPGADPGQIRLQADRGASLRLSAEGDLILESGGTQFRHRRPAAYQQISDVRREVDVRFVRRGKRTVGIEVGSYDRSKSLIIDPVLTLSTYVGGSDDDIIHGIAVDAAGNTYVTGETRSVSFPSAPAPPSVPAGVNAFVAKLNAAGNALVYLTYLGGTGDDRGRGIAVDTAGSAYVVGLTRSVPGFPLKNAIRSTGFASEIFVTKLNAAGSDMVYSTLYGGFGDEEAGGIAVDAQGAAYFTGQSSGIPVVSAVQPSLGGNMDAFIAKVNPQGSAWVYSTYFGGSGNDGGAGIAVDSTGAVCVAGTTGSTNFPVVNARQPSLPGPGINEDAFAVKLNPAGNAVVFSTYLGGSSWEKGLGAAMDAAGNCYVTGHTQSNDFPVANAAQAVRGGGLSDAFVTGYNSAGSAYLYSSYLGGAGSDGGRSIAVDGSGSVVVSGFTESAGFPAASPVQSFRSDGSVWSSSLGLPWTASTVSDPIVGDIAIDPQNPANVYAAGHLGLYRSTDYGATWTVSRSGLDARDEPVSVAVHPVDTCVIAVGLDTESGFSYATAAARSTNCGASFNSYFGPLALRLRSLSYSTANPDVLYGIAEFPRTGSSIPSYLPCRIPAGGGHVCQSADLGLRTLALAVARSNGCIVYAGGTSGVARSADCGALSFASTNASFGSPVTSLAVHPTNENFVLAGTEAGSIYRKPDAVSPWGLLATLDAGVSALEIDPVNPAVLYAGTSKGKIFKSADSGATWSPMSFSGSSVTSLAIDPVATHRVYASTARYSDAFVTRLNPAGTVTFSTFVGGNLADSAAAVALGGNGIIHVAGETSSETFPIVSGVQQAAAGKRDGFIARIDPSVTCTYSVTPAAFQPLVSGWNSTVSVSASAGCPWTSVASAPWISITGGASGSGNGTVSYSVAANPSATPRTGTITTAGQVLTLVQPGIPVAGHTISGQVTKGGAPFAGTLVTLSGGSSGTRTTDNSGNYSFADLPPGGSYTVTPTAANHTFVPPSASFTNLQASQSANFTACSFAFSQATAQAQASGGTGVVTITVSSPSCQWTLSSNAAWLTANPASGTGAADITWSAAPNSGAARTGTLTAGGQTFTLTQEGTTLAGNRFVPVTPCRIADTRAPNGPFGGPVIAGGTSRNFAIPGSACGIPSNAAAYSINVTVVPRGLLGFLTVWPSGQAMPVASTLNSYDGRVKANAAIVPAGTSGGISVFATHTTDVILDINGYFVPSASASALAFYPLTPCRIADTRNAPGPLGGPALLGGQQRSFPVRSSSCGVPATAQAYSLNFTTIPRGFLGHMSVWPTGLPMPIVSTLNATTGEVTANAAVVPASANGDISVFVTNEADAVIDINGYFAPPGAGGLSLFSLAPCRLLDTREPSGSPPFSGVRSANVAASSCGISASALAYVFSATVVPSGALGHLTLWPQGQAQPLASTLNALDGLVSSNMAIVPTTNGSVSSYATSSTHLLLDISGYFAP